MQGGRWWWQINLPGVVSFERRPTATSCVAAVPRASPLIAGGAAEEVAVADRLLACSKSTAGRVGSEELTRTGRSVESLGV